MAANPFPGMNPWLQTIWSDSHTSLVTYARDQIQPQLPADLRAVAQEAANIGTGPPEHRKVRIGPDVAVTEQDLPHGGGGTATLAAARPATGIITLPLTLPVAPVAPNPRWLEIHEVETERLVTVIEVLSPSNKRPGADRMGYLEKQQRLVTRGINLVEIDLVRGGRSVSRISDEVLPEDHRTDYRTSVYPARNAEMADFYRIPLREPLPTLLVPLRPTDGPGVRLDLQAAIDRACESGGLRAWDYAKPLSPPLSPGDAAWADACLRAAGLR